jgi:plasmid stability protein
MTTITIHNLPDETHRALLALAASHGLSLEAEILAILENTIRPEGRTKLGSRLAEIGREIGGVELEIERDKSLPRPVSFE